MNDTPDAGQPENIHDAASGEPPFGPRRRERGRPDAEGRGRRDPEGRGHQDSDGRGRPDPENRGRGRGHRGFGRGFDGPPRPQRARRGDVRSAVLSLLGREPQNGYRLMKAFHLETDGAWRPSPGSIYPTLTQLVEEGLIATVGEGRSTQFELTDAGRTYIVEHADELEQAWKSATGQSDQDLDFHASVTKLNGAIEQFRIAASDEQRLAGGKAIDDARRALYLILAE